MVEIRTLCDECGQPATTGVYGSTGHFSIGERSSQDADFCALHAPQGGRILPNKCQRVSVAYAGMTVTMTLDKLQSLCQKLQRVAEREFEKGDDASRERMDAVNDVYERLMDLAKWGHKVD